MTERDPWIFGPLTVPPPHHVYKYIYKCTHVHLCEAENTVPSLGVIVRVVPREAGTGSVDMPTVGTRNEEVCRVVEEEDITPVVVRGVVVAS